MAKPALLVENVFSDVQFPAHVVDASEEAAGGEAWRVATGRRSARDRWSTITPNAAAWIRVDCGAPRTCDMLALDRGHTLHGAQVKLQHSPDGATWTDALWATIPLAHADGTSLDAEHGATTREGAWLKRFTPHAARWWRFWIPALGAGQYPEVVGLWLGVSWSPDHWLDLPFDDEGQTALGQETEATPTGWRGTGAVAAVRDGELSLKLSGPSEYDLVRANLVEHFHAARRPMWIVYDADRAEGAVLGVRPPGRMAFVLGSGWGIRRQGSVAWVEHEPRPR